MTTGQDLVTEVRRRTDTVGSLHVTDAEILGFLNSALSETHEKLCLSFEDYSVTTAAFTLTSASTGITLPDDFYKELRVDRSLSSSASAADWYRMDRVNIRDETAYNQAAMQSSAYNRVYGYVLCGSQIRIVPKTQTAGVYQLLYYPAWADIPLSGAVVVGPTGQHWEKLAVYEACIEVAQKEETDPSAYIMQRDRLLRRLEEAAANRSAGQVEPPPVLQLPWYERLGGAGMTPWGSGI